MKKITTNRQQESEQRPLVTFKHLSIINDILHQYLQIDIIFTIKWNFIGVRNSITPLTDFTYQLNLFLRIFQNRTLFLTTHVIQPYNAVIKRRRFEEQTDSKSTVRINIFTEKQTSMETNQVVNNKSMYTQKKISRPIDKRSKNHW